METIYILNNYRMSFLDDPKALQIISLLYTLGDSTEEDISKKINLPTNEVNTLIAKLFSAKIVKRQHNSLYLSDLSKHAVFKTGVAEAINNSLIDELNLAEKDKEIFRIFINLDSDQNPYYSHTSHLFHHWSLRNEYNTEEKEDVFLQSLYSVIFGLNPLLKNHKSESFFDYFTNQLSNKSKSLTNYKKYYLFRFDQSKTNIEHNNSYVLDFHKQYKEIRKHSLISSSRLYCSIDRGMIDEDLNFMFKTNVRSKNNLIKIVFSDTRLETYFKEIIISLLANSYEKNDVSLENDSLIEFTSKMMIKSYGNNPIDANTLGDLVKVIEFNQDKGMKNSLLFREAKTEIGAKNRLNDIFERLMSLFKF